MPEKNRAERKGTRNVPATRKVDRAVDEASEMIGRDGLKLHSKAPGGGRVVDHETGLPPASVDLNVQALMTQAIERGVPIEYMRELVALFDSMRAKIAEREFNTDLAAAQEEFPIIAKAQEARDHTKCETCRNSGKTKDGKPCPDGKILYRYAATEDLVEKIGPIIARHGFSATSGNPVAFKHPDLGIAMMRSSCVVRHRGGHIQTTTVEVPIGEGTHLMTPMQLYMAAASFAYRYAYKKAFGLAERGEDIDVPEESPSEPRPVEGVNVDEHGRKVEKKEEQSPIATMNLSAAQAEMEKTYFQLAQLHGKNWKPLFNAEGDPIVSEKEAKRLYPDLAPFNRLLPKEAPEGKECLDAYFAQAQKNGDDAAALGNMILDMKARLAELRIEMGVKA